MIKVFVVIKGGHDAYLAGVYRHKRDADIVAANDSSAIIKGIYLEDSPNLTSVFEQTHINGKLEPVTESVYSTLELISFLECNPEKFKISWKNGQVFHGEKREFGCFLSWGFTEEECRLNMKLGLKGNCDQL